MGSSAPFDSTPEFQHFKGVMKRVIAIPKADLDERLRISEEQSPRKNNPAAPGRKRAISAKKRGQ
jgi:hypothetical protein